MTKEDELIQHFLSVARRICGGSAPRYIGVKDELYLFDLGIPGGRAQWSFHRDLIDDSTKDRGRLRLLENAIKDAVRKSRMTP